MMKAFILLCVFGAAFAVQECPGNSHFESCGSACPLTCENYDNPPKVCVLMCVAGCVCDEGYVRAIDGRCVKPEYCPALDAPSCGANSHYESCGTACPLTCENHLSPPEVCVLMCNPGCHCDEGFVKSVDGTCVRPQFCPALDPPMCNANSHYESCGTACPLTCENYENPPEACVLMCNPGCHCDVGYVKAVDGSCVEPQSCPARDPQSCHENSHYLECGTACPLTCDNYDNPPKICPAMCVSGCHCLTGFVKTEDGRCVEPENCPSKAARKIRPEEPSCFGEPEKGPCRGYIPMYHYDITDGTCKSFIYGGCEGNNNRFVTEKECMGHCEGVMQRSSNICELPQEVGNCRGYFPKYHYDSRLGKCTQFIYGGCGGNENNFETIEECQQTCGKQSAARSFDRADCGKIPETGPCKADIIRFYYDQKNAMCKPFVYGGCEGNANKFETEAECYNKCGALKTLSVCEQEKIVGRCRAFIPRYFFNRKTGQCEEFIYGGCDGNENNFLTLEDCHDTCVA